MAVAEPEPLTDAEAEGVLLALGPQLEWIAHVPHGHNAWYGFPIGGISPFKYSIKLVRADGTFQTNHLWTPGVKSTSLIEAKAACERHHATGKW